MVSASFTNTTRKPKIEKRTFNLHNSNIIFSLILYLKEKTRIREETMNLDVLPEDCFAHIVSLTSPEDACRLSLVSSMVHSMADLDSVWEGFLPSDYKGITSRLVTPVVYSTNKELFMRLCTPRLIDGGRKVISKH